MFISSQLIFFTRIFLYLFCLLNQNISFFYQVSQFLSSHKNFSLFSIKTCLDSIFFTIYFSLIYQNVIFSINPKVKYNNILYIKKKILKICAYKSTVLQTQSYKKITDPSWSQTSRCRKLDLYFLHLPGNIRILLLLTC